MNTYCIIMVLCLIPLTGASESWIVGGKTVKAHSRKYMVSLQCNEQHKCGGFLIRDDFVLTAAHCKCLPRMKLTVVLGAQNVKNKKEPSQQRIQVEKYFRHPKFNDKKFEYDIMLLKLKQKATLNKSVKPIALPTKDKKISAKTKCSVAGWGKTEPTADTASDVLREAVEKIQINSECKCIWNEYFNPDNMICTKFSEKRGSMCQGDSGGPLICNKKPLGIAAFTKQGDCSDPNVPHVYTKISSFLPWINDVMNGVGNVD